MITTLNDARRQAGVPDLIPVRMLNEFCYLSRRHFHGRKAVAPLKQLVLGGLQPVECGFPRQKSRGPIEAARRSDIAFRLCMYFHG